MGDLPSTCKDKLAYFRIKELKDVLTQLTLPKHGKKQDLIDRILALLSDDQAVSGQWHLRRGKKIVSSKESVAKIVDDIYMKMQVHGPPDLLSQSQIGADFNHRKPQIEQDQSYQLDTNCGCICGKTFPPGNVVKCEDCRVQQHMDCVLISDKTTEGVRPEVPAHFYCQLCRLSRADPFWLTTGNPLLIVRLMPSDVANDGTNVSQSVDKTFLLSRSERETVQRTEYDIQIWCMLLNDKVQFRMHWPQNAELQVNAPSPRIRGAMNIQLHQIHRAGAIPNRAVVLGVPVRVVPRPSSQLLGINGRDDGPVITTLCHEGDNKIMLSSVDTRPFCFGIRITKRRTVDQVLNLVPKEADGESFEDALARVCRCLSGGKTADDADSDSDLEVVADFFPVSLRCPNSGSRIRIAGRFKPCVHMGSFDLQTFVELNQRSRKWQCPTCLTNYSVENMIIDRYFSWITSLLQNCSEDVNEIDVKPDGSWRVKGDVENRELACWHMPDGSLCNLKQDTKPVAGDVNQFQKGSGYDGSESSKIGSKRNLNLDGTWEGSKDDDIKPSIVVNQTKGMEYHGPNIVPASGSHAGIYRDGEYLSVSEYSMQFDLINGHELDSFSHKFGQMYTIDDRSQKHLEDAGVIVLSDSDEENAVIISPPAAYDNSTANISGFAFAASTVAGVTEHYPEDSEVGGSGLGLFNDNSTNFDINPWSMQSYTQPEQGFQFFGTDTDTANNLVDSHGSSGMTPNAYTFDCNTSPGGTSMVQDLSTCHARTKSLVDHLLPFGNDDSFLRIFLPSGPSSVPTQEERNEHDVVSNGVHLDDWISLTLAPGGNGNEESEPADTLNPLNERRMEPLSDAAGSLLSLNEDKHNKENSNPRAGNIFSHPSHPRSVRPRLQLSINSDSD